MDHRDRTAPDVARAAGDADRGAAVFDFVADFLDDRAAGRELGLTEYLARFPGHEEAIAREYVRLTSDAAPEEPRAEHSDDGQSAARVGPYRLVRELGRGGQGAVWLAEDERLGRKVALKLLATPFITAERRARFRREAESIARLDHPGLAGVHDADLDAALPWIAMRYVEGQDLGAALEAARAAAQASEPPRVAPLVPLLPQSSGELARVLAFFERAARALHAAHEEGVVHRDVKPGNIMVAAPGVPVVLDFGLARGEGHEAAPAEALTREGEVFGTPAYMAPEQFSGRPEELDRRADVWSLGVTLYEALTGKRPFVGASPHALAEAILAAPIPDPRTYNRALPLDVKVVLETALERDRARRYPTALEFAEDLRRIREFEPVRARPAGLGLRIARWGRREPAWAAALTVTLLALVAGLGAALFALRRISSLATQRQQALGETRVALADKERALDLAAARLFVGQVPEFLARSPAGALALGLDAVARHDAWWTRSALFGPLENTTLERQLDLRESRVWDAALFDDGRYLVAGATGRHVGVFNMETGEALARRQLEPESQREEARRVLVVDSGRGVLVGCEDGSVRRLALPSLEDVWSTHTLSVTSSDDGPVQALELLPQSPERALAVFSEGRVSVLDSATGAEVLTFRLPPRSAGDAICAALVGPDGARPVALLAPRSRSGRPLLEAERAWLVALDDGALLAELPAGAAVQRAALAESAHGELAVALGTREGAVALYRVKAAGTGVDVVGPTVRELTRGEAPVEDLVALPSSSDVPAWGVALGRGVDAVVVALRGPTLDVQPLLGSSGEFGAVGLGLSDTELVAACTDGALRVVDPRTGTLSGVHLEGELADHVLFEPRARRWVSYGVWRSLYVWREEPPARAVRSPLPSLAGGEPRSLEPPRAVAVVCARGADGTSRAVAALHDGRVLALVRASATAPTWQTLATLRPPVALAAASDRGFVAAAGADGEVHAWDGDLDPRGTWTVEGAAALAVEADAPAGGGGPLVAVRSAGGGAFALRAAGVAQLATDGVSALALEVGTARVALGFRDGAVTLCEGPLAAVEGSGEPGLSGNVSGNAPPAWVQRAVDGGEPARRGEDPEVRDLAFVAPGRLVVASHQSRLDLIDVARATRLGEGARGALVRWLRPLGDGGVLALAEGVGSARVFRVSADGDGLTAERVEWERLHTLGLTSVSAAPGGAAAATGALDGAVHVFEPRTGELLARFVQHRGPIAAVDLGPDGCAASASADGTVALWPVDPTPLAREIAPRGLSVEEARRLDALLGGR